MTVNWDTTSTEADLIDEIAKRYLALIGHEESEHMRLDIRMDLTACHLNGTPLDLEGLSQAPDFALAHDVQEIGRHIDRTTGKLKGLSTDADAPAFVPRYAAPSEPAKGAA